MASRDLTLNLHERKTGNAMVEAARDLERVAKQADGGGDAFKRMESDAKKLDAQIVHTKATIKDLGSQIASTGDMSLFKDLRKEESNLRNLENLAKDLVPDATKAGSTVGNSFIGGIGSALDGGGPAIKAGLIIGLVGAAIEIAPMLGAVIGGGISGAVGTVAMAAGLFAASKSPAVRNAASDFGATVSKEFFGSGEAFVMPAIQGLKILERDFKSLDIGDSLEKVAGTVTTIASGIGAFAKNVMPGLNKALDRMDPFAETFANNFEDIGTALGGFIDDVSASEGALSGLEYLLRFVNGTLVFTGKAVNVLEDTFHGFAESASKFYQAFAAGEQIMGNSAFAEKLREIAEMWHHIAEPTGRAQDGINGVTGAVETFGVAADVAADKAGGLANAWRDLFGQQLSMDEAMLAAQKAVEAVGDTFEKGGKKVAGHSTAVLENRIALEQAAEAAAVAANQYLIATGDIEGAKKMMDEFRIQAEKNTGATGADARAVHDLAMALFSIPANVNSTVTVTTIDRRVQELHSENYRLFGGARASGGPVMAGKTYIVGERGPEPFTPTTNGYVSPNSSLSTMGSGGPLQVKVSFAMTGNRLMDSLLEALRLEISANGGLQATFN